MKGIFKIILLSVIAGIFTNSCGSEDDPYRELRDSLTFFASFDETLEADYSKGDPGLYLAPSWDQRMNHELFSDQVDNFQIHEGEGRYNDALWIDSRYEPVFFYKGEENMPYEPDGWSGSVSFWLRLDPAEDLHPGYSDPIQITAKSWNDGALFVDFTEEAPRTFRFAFFADRAVWDPDEREWDEVPFEERPMVEVIDPPFSREKWSHITFAFSNFNRDENSGTVQCYLNGEKYGVLSERRQIYSWDPSEVFIWLGYNYRGYFDELSIFNRELTDEEVQLIYSLEKGIRQIIEER